MWRKALLLTLVSLFCQGSPITEKSLKAADDIQLINPHVISIERFQSLLRRAGEIFQPRQIANAVIDADVPYEYMQPPNGQTFNYYQPLFEQNEHAKLDAKSRELENITPPPIANTNSRLDENFNYYAVKPKKLPKKFNAATKQLNMKWLNAFEKASTGAIGHLPRAMYLVNDESNRINFDDSFFAVDMHVKLPPNNEPFHDTATRQEEGNAQQNNEADFEDLMAVAAAQLPQISPNYATK